MGTTTVTATAQHPSLQTLTRKATLVSVSETQGGPWRAVALKCLTRHKETYVLRGGVKGRGDQGSHWVAGPTAGSQDVAGPPWNLERGT